MSLIFSLQSHKLAKGRKLGECEQFPDVHFFNRDYFRLFLVHQDNLFNKVVCSPSSC